MRGIRSASELPRSKRVIKWKSFLMNEGSELDTIPDSKDFDISAKVAEFKELKGEIYACGTCLKVRGKEESNICPVSTMYDLLKMVESSDKVLVFG